MSIQVPRDSRTDARPQTDEGLRADACAAPPEASTAAVTPASGVHSLTPGAMQETLSRELERGGKIEFEFAPAGWLTRDGERRQRDHRAYFWTPQPECPECGGSGRVPSTKREGSTVKCQPCNGSGACKRERMTSVTTLLDGILPKPGLPPWSEARGIEGAVLAMQLGEIDAGTDLADAVKIVRHLRLGADRARDDAADRGLNIHSLNEQYMATGEVANPDDHPVEHHGYIRAWVRWLLKTDPQPESVEQLVCDPEAGYAGRRDLVAMVGRRRLGYDLKTQERCGIYVGAHVQLRLYEEGAIACGDEPCDELRVVVFGADGEFREMLCEATPATASAALAFARAIRPIDSLCEGANRVERKARRS